ncbi:MAG: hypothetical protein AAGK38_08380, partial [Pseudomonadota bacterium]
MKNHKVLPDWRNITLPEGAVTAQTMLMDEELRMLYALGRDYYGGWGDIVDAGCFLGGSTQAMARGVLDNYLVHKNPRSKVIHSYDLYVVEPWTIGIYFPEGTPLGTSFEDIYRENIKDFSTLVEVNPGDVMVRKWPREKPIEILFIDLAKHWVVSDYMVREFFGSLVPGRSLVIQQDYIYHTCTGWLPVTMEYFSDYFELVDHTYRNSAVFLNTKKIPEELLNQNVIASLTVEQIADL